MSQSGKTLDNKLNETVQGKPEYEHTGQYLQKLRAAKGLTIKEVAEATRISEHNLTAIENQDFDTLPADTFTRGFLSIYARLLDIDPKETVQSFMQEREQKKSGGKRNRTKKPVNVLAPKTMAEPSHFSSVTGAFILLIIIAILFTAFCIYTSWNPFSFLTAKENTLDSIMMSVVPESQFQYQRNYNDTIEDDLEQPHQYENNEQTLPENPANEDHSKKESPVAESTAQYRPLPVLPSAVIKNTTATVYPDFSTSGNIHQTTGSGPILTFSEYPTELTLHE